VIYLDVNFKDEFSLKKLKVSLNDDPKTVAAEFAKKYGKIYFK
jgi:hypothetical protein